MRQGPAGGIAAMCRMWSCSAMGSMSRVATRRTAQYISMLFMPTLAMTGVSIGCKSRAQKQSAVADKGPDTSADKERSERPVRADRQSARADDVPFLKGQLHAHSSNSGDSQTSPENVAAWYARHGFDFVVFTDHNVITRYRENDDVLLIPGVELTHNTRRCQPPPEPGMACLLHVNALFVEDGTSARVDLPVREGDERRAIYRRSVALAERLGGVAQLNHPNFHYGADASSIAELGRHGLTLLEVANEAFDSNNQGDATHPSTEALWDAVLSQGVVVWGVATDDAHHYDDAEQARARGEDVFTGDRGFVMVRATRDRAAIAAALRRGDFYSSTGVLLRRVDARDGVLDIEVSGAEDCDISFIGERGAVLAHTRGRTARYQLAPGQRYVRALIVDGRGARAFTQPLFQLSASRPAEQ